jgi:hypothetical protein
MQLAPIVLFVYNRPWHTQQTLNALAKNELAAESILYVFADDAKSNATEEDLKKINQVHAIVKNQKGFKEIQLIKREKNYGLADNIVSGVTEVVNKFSKVIVLEDDIITSPYFLKFLNDGLNLYENSGNVYSINSYMFPIECKEATTFLSFLATSSWGWATWSEKWKVYKSDINYKSVIQNNKFLKARFNFADYNYVSLLDNKNSWAIKWYYSVFIRNGLGLFTTNTLSKHIGAGEDATHVKTNFNQMDLYCKPINVKLNEAIDFELNEKLISYFTLSSKSKLVRNLICLIKKISNK